ncbi:MAG TPA: hypothetical protein VFL83_01070 [Anaeromyxobacter sp.]|nr:hypothetical protein [Anaeromyxobacter sp.]
MEPASAADPRPPEAAAPADRSPAPAAAPGAARWYWAAFGACALAALGALWGVKYLPMADLPQHAAQVSIWMHLDDPSYGYAREFEVNRFSPYLLGYALARLVATFTSVVVAVKIVVTLAILALPLSMQLLLDRVGGDRYWALAGFPLAFGVAFYWGLLNYLVALPAGIAFVALAASYAAAPTLRRGVVLGLAGCVLYLAHALVLATCGAAAVAVIALRARGLRRAFVRALPLAAPFAVAIAWARWTHATETQVQRVPAWNLGLRRIWELPSVLLGRTFPDDGIGVAETAVIVLVAATVPLAGRRLGRDVARWLPAAVCTAAFLLSPSVVFGTALIHERFAVLAGAFLVVAAAPLAGGPATVRLRVARGAVVAVAVGWLIVLGGRFRGFDAEAAGFDTVAAHMVPHRKALGLIFTPASAHVPGAPHLHAIAWYQAQKGGVVGFSFATFFPELIRYGPNASGPVARELLAWRPLGFAWQRDGWYDYFVVRAPVDPRALFRQATVPIRLVVRDGEWWLFEALRG